MPPGHDLRARSAGIDLVRVVAIVAIVAGHVWTDGSLRSVVYPWHVPVFFFLTGLLWKRDRPLADEARRRARSLLVPYVTWLGVVALLFSAVSLIQGDRVALGSFRDALLGGSYAGRPFSAFWFVTALFFAAVLYRLISRWPLWLQWLAAVVGVVAAHGAGDLLALIPLGAGLAVPSIVFMVAGRTCAGAGAALDPRTRLPVGVASLLSGAAVAAWGATAPVDLKAADLGTPVAGVVAAVLVSWGLVLVAEAVGAVLPPALGRAATLLASCGLMVVLSHALVLWILDTPPSGDWLHFAAALLLPWVAAVGLVRSRWAPVLLGRPAVQRPADERSTRDAGAHPAR